MPTMHRRQQYRRFHGTRPMQMLGGLILTAGGVGLFVLLGVAYVDWFTAHDTLATLARGAWR